MSELEQQASTSGNGDCRGEPFVGPLPTVTAAICTCDRPVRLVEAMHSLARQKYPADEVLVVDSGVERQVRDVVQLALPQARYIHEQRAGPNDARNAALSAARSEVLAFLDDDAQADMWWVRSIAEAFAANPKAVALSGLVLPLELEPPHPEPFEANRPFTRGFRRRIQPREGRRRIAMRLPPWTTALANGNGGSLAFRTAALLDLGGFEDTPDATNSGLSALDRLMRAGHPLVYEAQALVRRQIEQR